MTEFVNIRRANLHSASHSARDFRDFPIFALCQSAWRPQLIDYTWLAACAQRDRSIGTLGRWIALYRACLV